MEQDLDIINTGKKDKAGNEIKNINLKTRLNKATGDVTQGLTVGNFITAEKVFPTGYKNDRGSYCIYSCKIKYKDEEVSFTLNEKEHNEYKVTGGMGDKVKITLESYEYTYENAKKTATRLVFELVE